MPVIHRNLLEISLKRLDAMLVLLMGFSIAQPAKLQVVYADRRCFGDMDE